MSHKSTVATISTSDPVSGAREALRLARMLCREAAALRPDRDATKRALEAAVAALSVELIDLTEALEEDGAEIDYVRDMQRALPGIACGVAA